VNVERWGWYSVALNVLLAGLHAVIATASGSLAVAAELIHNLIDLVAAVAVLAGLKLAGRKSKAFPYGLYKIENLVALGLAAGGRIPRRSQPVLRYAGQLAYAARRTCRTETPW